jgi:NADH pyrophosphatase NudC (nudix superfamily)
MQESVVREAKRETGTAVQVIRYFGSQPWPFPYSPMTAYTATYTAGEISIDDTEIEEAGWFTVDNLPPIPEGSVSLANQSTGSLRNKANPQKTREEGEERSTRLYHNEPPPSSCRHEPL